eukprot:SAG25_NODE_9484_length_370_cov_1.324723_1_plen_62_part_10
MLIFPWGLVLATVPDLGAVYAAATTGEIIEVVIFGACWGLGSTTFGLGCDMVGNSLGFSIIL